MCHRRGDWSRTPSRVSESDEDPDSESDRAWWGSRVKEQFVTFVSPEETGRTPTDETPEADEPPAEPTVEPEPETAELTESEAADEAEEDEREEEPIPADD